MAMNRSANALQSAVTIWGGGLIGYTLALELASKGRDSVIIDTDPIVVERINAGRVPRDSLRDCIHHVLTPAIVARMSALAFQDCSLIQGERLNIICVPTEQNGSPLKAPLLTVCSAVADRCTQFSPQYLLIESTIPPSWIDEIHELFRSRSLEHGKAYHVAASPRRDVFNDPHFCIANIAKVAGADTELMAEVVRGFYSQICNSVHFASDSKHAMMSKVVENYLRLQSIRLVNGISQALRGFDMVEVCKLAATKWNVDKYHPSLGIGGYCVPLSEKYLEIEGGAPALSNGDSSFDGLIDFLRDELHGTRQNIAILGVAYAPGLKVHANSVSTKLIAQLHRAGFQIGVHDPLYSAAELTEITACEVLDFPNSLQKFDAVIIATPHSCYSSLTADDIRALLSPECIIIDNMGAWGAINISDRRYWEVGRADFERLKKSHQPVEKLRQPA